MNRSWLIMNRCARTQSVRALFITGAADALNADGPPNHTVAGTIDSASDFAGGIAADKVNGLLHVGWHPFLMSMSCSSRSVERHRVERVRRGVARQARRVVIIR